MLTTMFSDFVCKLRLHVAAKLELIRCKQQFDQDSVKRLLRVHEHSFGKKHELKLNSSDAQATIAVQSTTIAHTATNDVLGPHTNVIQPTLM